MTHCAGKNKAGIKLADDVDAQDGADAKCLTYDTAIPSIDAQTYELELTDEHYCVWLWYTDTVCYNCADKMEEFRSSSFSQ